MFKLFKSVFRQEPPQPIETKPNNGTTVMTPYEETRFIELMTYVNKPVIIVSNEWQDLQIGFGVSVDFITKSNVPALVVKSYLTGEEFITFGNIFHYTTQRFNALMALDPFERWCLIQDSEETFTKARIQPLLSSKKEILNKLKMNGFFLRIGKDSPIGNCTLRNLVANNHAIQVSNKIAKAIIPSRDRKFLVYLMDNELQNTFVNSNPDYVVSSCFENAVTKELTNLLAIVFFVSDLEGQKEILDILENIISENHSLTKHDTILLWEQSKQLWQSRYGVSAHVTSPTLEWGEIKVMLSF